MQTMRLPLAFILTIGATSGTARADFATGKQAYERGDFEAAAREWREAADKGDVDSQYMLGTLYENGRGVPRDFREALKWEWQAAKGGNQSAQKTIGWPFKAEDDPFLTCASYPAPKVLNGAAQPVQMDNIEQFRFELTLHNLRRVMQAPLISGVENQQVQPKDPNVEIEVYRIENGQRKNIAYKLESSGGSGGGPQTDDAWFTSPKGIGITNASIFLSVRIPVAEDERQQYANQFLAELAKERESDANYVDSVRRMVLHLERPGSESYIDHLLPNRVGTYEIVCRYQSHKAELWPGYLEAPALRFEYVKKREWIDLFRRKAASPK
jgi:hypothetical protein